MSAYTRVTLTGGQANVEVLLPSAESVDTLLPDIVRLLQLPPHEHPQRLVLTPVGGPTLDGSRSLEQAGIADGALLTVLSQDDAVPSPVVYDVTDHVASRFGSWQERWLASGRSLVLGACVAGLLALAFWWLAAPLSGTTQLVAGAATAAVLLAVVAAPGPGRFPLAWALLLAAVLCAGLGLSRAQPDPTLAALVSLGVAFLAVEAWLVHTRRWQAAVLGATALLLLAVVWALALLLVKEPGLVCAVTGTVTVLVVGYLPRLALGIAGLNALDDRRQQRQAVERGTVEAALGQAHAGLVAAMAWCSLSAVAATAGLLTSTLPEVWALPLSACWLVVLALRIRSFPLTAQRLVLALGVLALAALNVQRLSLVAPWLGAALGAVALVGAVLIAVPTVVQLPDHSWARLRLLADRLETLATVAIIPLVLGAFGVYQTLLASFGK